MQIQEGFSYHIKDDFFMNFKNEKLLKNKDKRGYRPHYYVILDPNNEYILWMIPISSKYYKYSKLFNIKKQKYGRCDTIVLGKFSGKNCAFLIQN